MRVLSLLIVGALFAGSPAWAVSDKAYERAVDYIQRLYLYPDQVDAASLLQASARGLADELDWLLVEAEGDAVHLRHGSGAPIGSVSVASMTTLPDALLSLEALVIEAGYDLGGVDPRLELLRGMTHALDRYSRILSGERLERFDVRLKGTLVGIGATLHIVGGRLTVKEVVKDGPAAGVGLAIGDVITRIDGVSTVNMALSEATRRIRGDIDTLVVLSVDHGGKVADRSITRAEIVVPNVRTAVLEGGVGYVEITHFSQRTVQNLVGALDELRVAGALDKGLVIDLRGNTGGSMKEAANAADLFLREGMLLRTAGPDGGQVQNLQARMDATDQGTEPDVPIVVLMDQRTASGSEILAGALLELDRAALIGTRSYGKGTVQKIYNLDEQTRFKLTVAEYLLEHDRSIASIGLEPDVALAPIELDEFGVRYEGWSPRAAGRAWDEVLPIVHEHAGWRGRATPPRDVPTELARRAILASTGWSRASVVAALEVEAPKLRAEEEARLVEALEDHGIDWSAPEVPVASRAMIGDVRLKARPDPLRTDAVIVEAEVTNRSPEPIHQALVELACDTLSLWAGVVIPIGRVEPGKSAHGQVVVSVPPGLSPREDVVLLRLRAADRDPVMAGEEVLGARSAAVPRFAVTTELRGEGTEQRAVIQLTNLSTVPVDGLEVYFEAPGDLDVELVDQAAALVRVDPTATAEVELHLRVSAEAPATLPLHLVVESDRYGRIEEWPVALTRAGGPVRLEGPRLVLGDHPLSAMVGPFPVAVTAADDRAVDHVVLYANGTKVAWIDGVGRGARLESTIELEVGTNRLVAVAVDDQGLERQLSFSVRGELEAAVDAADPRPVPGPSDD